MSKVDEKPCYYCGNKPRISDGMCIDCLTDDIEDCDF